ncbi:MAG: type I-B CRISPR-associated protein Cas5b [Clostridium sp.]
MDVLRFELSGKTAFFKKPDMNSYLYFTYGNIHKVALLGIFGAILGYGGYNQMKDGEVFPEFYEKLKDVKISIEPKNKKGFINKKVQVFNNSVGYASEELGGNLIVKEQWLENPCWNIYLLIDSEESKKIANSILENKVVYIPYLGKNDHLANISDVRLFNNIEEAKDFSKIDSLFLKEQFEVSLDEEDYEEDWDEEEVENEEEDYEYKEEFKYEESLPISLDESLICIF